MKEVALFLHRGSQLFKAILMGFCNHPGSERLLSVVLIPSQMGAQGYVRVLEIFPKESLFGRTKSDRTKLWTENAEINKMKESAAHAVEILR